MSEAVAESLTDREKACLEHLRQAQELGVSFAEYCRNFDLNVTEWYPVKQALARKGAISVAGRSKPDDDEKSAGFAPVRIVPSASNCAVACRVRHPSGWMLELPTLPDGEWLRGLMAGDLA